MQESEGRIHVFIDTSILEDCKYCLDYPPLQRVLKAEHVVLHTTRITLAEVQDRITGQVVKHRQAIEEAQKWMVDPGEESANWLNPDRFIEQYKTYCKHEHGGRGADLGLLVDLCIHVRAPFSSKKPDEFRDAIAALSLHHWAKAKKQTIYIVAKDPDWQRMCSTFSGFTFSTLGELHAHLFKLDSMKAELDMASIADGLLGEKGRPELEAELGRVRPQIIKPLEGRRPTASDVDSQFVEVSTLSLTMSSCDIIGVEISVKADFSGKARVRYRDETVEVSIFGILTVAVGVRYAYHRVDIDTWSIHMPSEYPARVFNLSQTDQS